MFKLERVRRITVLPETFTRQAGFCLHEYHAPTPEATVDLLFDNEVAQWVRERPVFHSSVYKDTPEGLKVTLSVRHPDETLSWILSWGAKVRVLSPQSLRARLREELEAMRLRF